MENPSIVRLGAQWHKQHFSGSKKGKDFKNCNLNAEDHDQASKFLGAVFSDVRFRTPDYSWFFSEHTQPSTIPCKSLTWLVCQETIAHHDWCKWFYRLDLFICFRVFFANQSLQASQTDKLTNCGVIGLQVVWIGDAPIVDSSFPKLILNPQEYPHGFLKPCRNVCIWFLHYCRSNPWFDGLDHVESCYICWLHHLVGWWISSRHCLQLIWFVLFSYTHHLFRLCFPSLIMGRNFWYHPNSRPTTHQLLW